MTSDTIDLTLALERCLAERFGIERSIVNLRRVPSEYRSSFAIEDLNVVLDDSTELQVVFKNLGRQGLLAEALPVKPAFIYDPVREISVYDKILSSAGLGTAACYGFVADSAKDRYWLFIEKVKGLELYQAGDLAVWENAAMWLARMHSRLHADPQRASRCHLLIYDADFYELWLARALKFCETRDAIEWIAERYDRVIERLLDLSSTFIHGEFYASNVIVAESGGRVRICPVDWEMAAIGPSAIDVAALTAGKWSDAERRQLALAYWSALDAESMDLPPTDEFLDAVEYCRLHLCIQWLGWAPQWSPPKEHAQDWLGEAVRIAERLRL